MSLFDNIKSAISIAQKLKDPQLMEHLMNLQMGYLELDQRNRELEKENETLKKKQTTQQSLIFEQGVYFSKTEDQKDGPFCTKCWDVDKILVRLRVDSEMRFANCPQCETGFDLRYNHPALKHLVPY